MDEAFSNLDDLSERETYERLESLFESSLPPVSTVMQTYKMHTVIVFTRKKSYHLVFEHIPLYIINICCMP